MKTLAVVLIVLVSILVGWAQTARTNGIAAPGKHYTTSRSNLLTISNAVKIASGLRVGMPKADVDKYLQDHGMTQANVGSLSLDRGRTMKCPYPVAGDTMLMLEMHCTKAPPGLFGWSNPVLDRAYIQSGGSNAISIRLSTAP